jgi:hypothetical protein
MQGVPAPPQLAWAAVVDTTMLATNAAAPNPSCPAISRRLLASPHVRRKRDGFCQQLRFRQLMQHDPDRSLVLPQRVGDIGDGLCGSERTSPIPQRYP